MKRSNSSHILGVALLGSIALLGAGCQQTASVNTDTNTEVTLPTFTPDVVAPTTPASPAQAATANTVSITASGFSPATLTVSARSGSGATVTFTNMDSAPHRIASDPHPVHTGLAGFDALNDILPGGTYVFTFVKAGTFGYHDHLHPFVKGTVIVQ